MMIDLKAIKARAERVRRSVRYAESVGESGRTPEAHELADDVDQLRKEIARLRTLVSNADSFTHNGGVVFLDTEVHGQWQVQAVGKDDEWFADVNDALESIGLPRIDPKP